MKLVKEVVPYVVIIVVVLLIRTFIVTPVTVDGPSMRNTLYDNDLMVLKKYDKNYERNEIVVFKRGKDRLIKRVIGLPGEKIKCVGGIIYINNEEYKDEYGVGETEDFKEYSLANDEYFVMGDNRGNSADSRIFGPVKKENIMGSTDLIIFPFNRIRKF